MRVGRVVFLQQNQLPDAPGSDIAGVKIGFKTQTAALVECGLQPGKFSFVLELIFTSGPHEPVILVSDLKTADQVPTKPAGRCGSGPQVIPILIPMMRSEGRVEGRLAQ